MLCVFMDGGISVAVYVMLSLMSLISPPLTYVAHRPEQSCMLIFFFLRGELGFLICDDVCMLVFEESFELLEFVVYAVYVDLQNDEIFLVFTARSVGACGVYIGQILSELSESCQNLDQSWPCAAFTR